MAIETLDEYLKRKKKKKTDEEIAPTKTVNGIQTLDDFAKENKIKLSVGDANRTSTGGGSGAKGSSGSGGFRGSSTTDIDELYKQQKELQEQLNSIELTKDKNQWWDKDDNIFENVGNVIYQAILNPNYKKDQYVKDEKFKQKQELSKQLSVVNTAIEDYQVANKQYEKGVVGGAEKTLDTILGNATTARRGIETTISKVLGQTPSEDVESLTYEEKLSQKARQETTGAGGVALDVVGSISRMLPQMAIGNPIGATVAGFANYGGGAYNQARQDGYGDKEATAYGIAIGGMEMALTHALGSFGDIYGKTPLGKSSQNIINKTIPKIISNKQVRELLVQFGSEGTEEFLQEYIDGIARDTLLDGEGLLKSTWKNITDPDKFSDALYSAFVGGLTGSTMGVSRAIDSYRYEKATGRNYETGLTKNEQAVVDNVNKERTENVQKEKALQTEIDKQIKEMESTFGTISEAEKTGIKNRVQEQLEAGEIDFTTSKLSKKEIAKIEQEVRQDLEKGNLDIDTIENTLLGEKKAQIKQLEQELANTKGDTEKAQIQAKINELQSAKATELQSLLSKDYYLQNSYREANLKGEQFTYEAAETDSEYKKSLANDFSKVANNTTKTHELFETLSKIAEDKQTSYGVINNEQLKQLGYDVEGKDVNGLVRVNEDGTQKVLINIDSEKAINRIVGHETTHLLEGTKEYTELQQMVKQYATTKGDYDTKVKELTKLYEGTNANIENEVTADLVGDYLFTDSDFINNLSTQKPTIFQKIYNEIKHLYKLATAGSKEARQLERVKKAFDKAYKQNVKGTETDTKYAVSERTIQGTKTTVSEAEDQIYDFVESQIDKHYFDVDSIEGIYLHGSRLRGNARNDSDLDAVMFYIGNENEDYIFSTINDPDNQLEIDGLKVDINPISIDSLSDIDDYIARSEAYDKEVLGKQDTKYSLSESIPLENRVSGDDLLDAQDLIDEVKSVGAKVDENGYVTVYHQTSNENAQKIKETGKMISKELDIFFSTSKDAQQAEGKGQTKLEFKIPAEKLVLDDIFSDNADVKIPLNGEKSIDVSNYLVTEADTKYSLSVKSVDEQLYDKYSERVDNGYNVVKEYQQKYDDYNNTEEFKNAISRMVKENIDLDSETYINEIKPIIDKSDEIQKGLEYWKQQLERDKAELDEIAKRIDATEEANKPKLTPEEIVKNAEKHFGTTMNFKETAYITTNGNNLDFSGKKDGGTAGTRSMDHREIAEIDTTMEDFVKMGNIRLKPEGNGFEVYTMPNSKQIAKLYDYIYQADGEIYVDVVKDDGSYDVANYKMGTPARKIMSDLETYFKTGSFPQKSEFADFYYSLSNPDVQTAPVRGDVFGSDIKLQIEEAIAPIQEAVTELTEQIQEIAPIQDPDFESTVDYSPVTEADLPMLEQQYEEDFRNIDESNMPMEVEDTTPEAEDTITETKDLFETRDYSKVGNRKIKAYQYDNPEVKPYFQEAAITMYSDLELSTKGERYIVGDTSQMGFGDYEYTGTKRHTADDIAELLDGIDGKYKLSYDEIRKGLDAIIKDEGAENNAASKRIEFYLDQRLRNGYTTLDGYEVPANQEYLDTLREIEISNYYNNIPIDDSMIPTEAVEERYAPIRNVSNSETIVPSREIGVNRDGQGRLDLGLNRLNAPEGQPLNRDVEAIDLENARQLTIDGTEENLVTKTKKELRKALLGTEARKEFILSALDNAKNRSMALMNNTDTIRNTELVFGRDAGNVINEIVFQPEIDNEARSIAWQNQQRQEIKDLGIKARSKESAAVQKYGEKQYVETNGEVVSYTDEDLVREFPNVETQNKIKNAAKAIRKKYDTYIDEANNVLTKLGFEPIKKRNDYMRHFQELNDVFSRYGIPFNAQNMAEHTLPTDINGLTEFWSPQKNYFANMQERKGLKTTYDAITGIDGYISGISNLIFHTEDIQRGRAFEDLIRETYGEDKGWENLESLPEELQQARAEKIQDNHLSNYAAWVHEWTNNVAGKKNKLDRSVEAVFGRKAFSLLDQTRKQVGSNMIGLNLSSSLTNLIAPVQAMAKTNKLAVLKGTADTIKNMFVKDNFMEKNKFLTSRMGTDMLSRNAWQKIQDAGFVFMKGMDWFSSNQIVRSKYYELRAKGMSEAEAHSEAGKFAARILGDRTKGANAQLYNSKLIGLVTQFQLEVNNQLYSMFYDTYHESKENAQGNAARTAAGMTFTLGQLFIFTHLFGQTFEAIAGYNPTFDVIEMLKTAFGWGEDDEDEEKTTSERLKAAADQLVDALPYVNILTGGGRIPVASGIPNLVGVATGGKDEYGNELTLEDEMKKLLFLLPPTGGNQIKKTTQGLSMFDDELPVSGSYTDSGNLRFPVEDTPLNRIQAGLFGQWANKNAGEYFDKERQPLKEKQIQEYADLDMPIADYWEYRDGLKEQNTIQEKFDYINSLDVTDEQKNIMINNAVERKEDIDLSNYDDFGSYEEFDYATKNPEKYSVISQIDSFDKYTSYKEDIASIKEQFSTENGYSTEQRKAAVQQYIQSLSLDVPQKIMLEKIAGGYSIKNYKSYMFSYIESLPLTAEEKQTIHNELFD